MKRFPSLFAVLMFASAPLLAEDVSVAEATAAPVTEVSGLEVGVPAPGKGQVVFFRPFKMTGAVIGFKVREGSQELGKLNNGNYFVIAAEPGKHEYAVRSEAKDVLTLDVDAGEVYYVMGSISMGVLAGRPNLSPADSAAFEQVREKLKMSTL